MADLALLATLKDKLIHADNFASVTNYFFDHFGEDPSFLELGKPIRHPFLEAVVKEVAVQMFGPAALAAGQQALVTTILLTSLPEHQFIHGGISVGTQLGNVFYFENEGIGLLTITMPPPSQETKFARFRGQKVHRAAEPSAN